MSDGPLMLPLAPKAVQVVIAIAIIAMVWVLSDVILILFFAVLFACVLHGLAKFLGTHTGMRESYALALITISIGVALTVVAMTTAGALFGLLGLALGTPLAATGLVVVRMLYVNDVLGDDTVHDEGMAGSPGGRSQA